MEKLIGREREMGELESFLSDPVVRGCAVYGIRQVGKSIMLKTLASTRRAVYIEASRGSERAVVERAMRDVRYSFPVSAAPTTFSGLLDVLESICAEAPTLIIIDEYPYLSASMEHADSMLQGFIDNVIPDTSSKIIICGSQISSILEMVRDRANPLYNRFRYTLEIGPLSFADTILFHQDMDDMDLMRMYMVLGGMPLNHLELDGPTFRDVVERRFLGRGLPYRLIARGRMGSEVEDVDTSEAIVRAIAAGRATLKEISQETGIATSTCSKRLDMLERIDIVDRINPMAGAPKRGRFRLKDGLVAFWYTVFDGLDEFYLPDDPKDRYGLVAEAVDTFMGHRFELFCAEFMAHRYPCDEIGSWWGVEKDEDGNRVGVDIDLVATVRVPGRKMTVFGECKFRNRMMKLSDLERLESRARKLDKSAVLVLFSAGGFERQLEALAWMHGAVMIGTDELMGRKAPPRPLEPRRPDSG